MEVTCMICEKKYSSVSNLRKHQRTVHGENKFPYISKNIKCLDCESFFGSVKKLREHLKSHGFDMSEENLTFNNMEEFYVWKQSFEKDTFTSYVKESGAQKNDGMNIHRYVCHRSGIYVPKGSGIRCLKAQGSCKLQHYCTSFIIAMEVANEVKVNFGAQHYAHQNDLKHLRLNASERNSIALKLQVGVTFDRILADIRDEYSGGSFERIHLLEKRDLHNLLRDFGISRNTGGNSDVENVQLWVCAKPEIVLTFKQQHQDDEANILNKEDFLIAIMTQSQADLLKRFGSYVCVDSTHGTNAYEFQLTTVLVIDENGRGFPVAFCVSNRTDAAALTVFFSAVAQRVGSVKAEVFMSDDAPAFYTAWKNVMGEAEKKLLCSWHVDRAWRNNLKKVQGAQEKKVLVYKCLRILMEHNDDSTFHTLQSSIIAKLQEDTDMEGFAKYFQSTYSSRPEMWACCFRNGIIINTNNHLESLHNTIKYVYLKGAKNRNVARLLDILVNIVKDKMFARLIWEKKGKKSLKLRLVEQRHEASHEIPDSAIKQVFDGYWMVLTTKSYAVKKLHSSCAINCNLRCSVCGICIHMYVCSCSDNVIHSNMCKHIHAVCRGNIPVPSGSGDLQSTTIESDMESLAELNQANQSQPKSADYLNVASQKLYTLATLLKSESVSTQLTEEMSKKVLEKVNKFVHSLGIEENDKEPQLKCEPANKKVTKQQDYKSTTKRQKVTDGNLSKPTENEKSYILSSIDENTDVEVVHTGFDHTY